MRNNPFITIVLLILINILLYSFIKYFNQQLLSSASLNLFLFFSTPVSGILISIFIKDILHKKEIQYFSIILLLATLLVGGGIAYFGAVAKSFQH